MARRNTPPHGVDVDLEVPRPEELRDFDSIPPPIKEQLVSLSEGLSAVVMTLNRVISNRDESRLEQIDMKLASLGKSATRSETLLDEYLVPQLDSWRAATEQIARELPKVMASLEGVTMTVKAIDGRLRDLEVEMRTNAVRWDGTSKALDVRISSIEATRADHESRIKKIENSQRDENAVRTALAKRERTRSGKIASVVGVLAGGIAAAIAEMLK